MYKKTILENGIRIVTEEIPHVRSVTMGFWLRSGSRDEDATNNGISHFIEHLMFKGTATRSAREIAEAIDSAGGQLNAFTSKEHTCYYARVLDEHLPLAAEILSDMLLHSTLAEVELEKEKGVILEEIKMYEDSPDELVHDLFAETLLSGHPLGRGVLGRAENIRALTQSDIRAYMMQHYTAGNLVIAAAGHVAHDDVVDVIQRHFSALGGPATPLFSTPVAPAMGHSIRQKETEQVHLCLGSLGLARSDADRYALYIIDTALGGGMSSRLFQELREERGLVYSTYSYHSCFHETGLFTVYAGTSPTHAPQVIELIRDECRRTATEGIRGEELARAKEQLKGSLMLSLESTANRMSRLAKAELFDEPLLTPDELIACIDAVSEEDTLRVSQLLFRNELVLAAVGPMPSEVTTV